MPEHAAESVSEPTRMIALGSEVLTTGFSLIGFETVPDATPEQLETLLRELVRDNQTALLIIECDLARSEGKWLKRVREEGGRIVVAEVPPLQAPGSFRPRVEDLVKAILGASALDERA